MADKTNILYVQTSNLPERQYSPLVLAQSAKAMDIDAPVYYLGMGLTFLKPGEAEKIQLGSFPSVAEMLEKTLAWASPSTSARPPSRCSAGRQSNSSRA